MSSTAANAPILVAGCDVLDVPATGECSVLAGQDIWIRDGWIVSIAPSTPRPTDRPLTVGDGTAVTNVQVIDGRGLLATPGLVNAHTHSPMTLFRGAAEDVSVEAWFNERVWPMEANLTEHDVYLGALLACAEMIDGGVTGFADHYFHPNQIARAATESGLRADIAGTYFSSQGQGALAAGADFVREWNGAAGGRIGASLGPHAPYTVTDDDLRTIAQLAAELGVGVHIHASENLAQTTASRARLGRTPIEVLARAGLLDTRVLIAHGCGIVPSDHELLASRAANIVVATCPKVYLKHALSPLTPIPELQSAGVTVAAGTDGAAGHNTLDVWEAMRLVAMTQKFTTGDATYLTVSEALRIAMRGGARALGLGPEAGALAPGTTADLLLIDLSGLHHQPVHDARAALVYGARPSDVRVVIVDGRILKQDGRLTEIDHPALLAEIRTRAGALAQTTGRTPVQVYEP